MTKPLLWTVMAKQSAQAASVSPYVLDWLDQAGKPGGAHGYDLLHALVHCTSHPEQVVDELLAWWCQVELVQPAKLSSPTHDQRFLGHGGRLIGYGGQGQPPPLHPPCWYRFARVGPIWLRGSGWASSQRAQLVAVAGLGGVGYYGGHEQPRANLGSRRAGPGEQP